MQINKLYKSEKVNNLKCSKTKLPWFSCLLQHSARKRSSYSGHLSLLPSTVLETSTSQWSGHLAVWSEKDHMSGIILTMINRLWYPSRLQFCVMKWTAAGHHSWNTAGHLQHGDVWSISLWSSGPRTRCRWLPRGRSSRQHHAAHRLWRHRGQMFLVVCSIAHWHFFVCLSPVSFKIDSSDFPDCLVILMSLSVFTV